MMKVILLVLFLTGVCCVDYLMNAKEEYEAALEEAQILFPKFRVVNKVNEKALVHPVTYKGREHGGPRAGFVIEEFKNEITLSSSEGNLMVTEIELSFEEETPILSVDLMLDSYKDPIRVITAKVLRSSELGKLGKAARIDIVDAEEVEYLLGKKEGFWIEKKPIKIRWILDLLKNKLPLIREGTGRRGTSDTYLTYLAPPVIIDDQVLERFAEELQVEE